jgi:hypothetical protein
MSHIDIYTKAFKAFNLMTIQSDLQCSLPQESYVTYYCTLQVLWVTFATIEVCHNVHWEQHFQVPTSREAISCIV